MKKIIYLITAFAILGSIGCKKKIEDAQEDIVIKAMTDGEWKVTNFILNGDDKTADFATYKFKYYANKTVDAIKNNSVEKLGVWDGNASAKTTYANFSGVSVPLSLINGTWNITRNGWTYVEATQTVGADTKNMRLDKL